MVHTKLQNIRRFLCRKLRRKTVRQSVLEQAIKCVCGDREKDYGTPEDNFKVIADLWTAYFGQTFTAVDVAVFLALVKIGRIAGGHGKEDNWVDLAGYAACGGEIESEKGDRAIYPDEPFNPHEMVCR